ncbi:hypothetical protein V0288_04410 [Pannus brasiliensis CCIBt3594]|uniref:Uncharacterized protein n=1 Tax=Pannus brasiliensis CCIBt3594 TaxID=1427578 RepID=A0AAW9QMI0_9CHRO
MRITLTERIESIKVGGIAALAFAIPSLFFLWVHVAFLGEALAGLTALVRLVCALISGFLFGVTYRYIVRDDGNPHLRDGAVAAFSLVRGLVPLQLSEDIFAAGTRSGLFLGESFVCFAICRVALDRMLSRK